MKKVLVALFMLGLQAQLVFAQTADTLMLLQLSMPDTVGYFAENKKPILSQGVLFNHEIASVYFDSLNNVIPVLAAQKELKNMKRGFFAVADSDLKKLNWYRPMNFVNQNFFLTNNVLVIQKILNRNVGIDMVTGRELWEVDNPLLYAFRDLNVGITYKNKFIRKNDGFYGINLKTGETLWERDDISFKKGLSPSHIYRDSTLVFASNKINCINIRTGQGTTYTMPIVEECTNIAYAGTCYRMSNFLRDSSFFTVAGSDRLIRMDYRGKLLWETMYGSGIESGRSVLLQHPKDSSCVLLNLGHTFLGGSMPLPVSQPFLARYKADGSAAYWIQLDRYGVIQNIRVENDTLIIIHKRAISKHSLANGGTSTVKEMEKREIKSWNNFVDKSVYLQHEDGRFKTLHDIDSTKYYLSTTDDDVIGVTKQFNTLIEYKSDDYWVPNQRYGNYVFLRRKKEYILIDKDGVQLASFKNINRVQVFGKAVYFITTRQLYRIDMSTLTRR